MLFVMVMEVLNHLLDWIDQRGLLEPIGGLEHKVSLYADDLVLFIRPDERSLLAVKTALNIFGGGVWSAGQLGEKCRDANSLFRSAVGFGSGNVGMQGWSLSLSLPGSAFVCVQAETFSHSLTK